MENKAILIIEDEEINRILLTNMLKEEYKILEARDGQEGLDILIREKGNIKLILLDIYMPRVDGFEFLIQARMRSLLEKIPIIMVTAASDSALIQRAYDLGVSDVVNKPYHVDILRRRVSNTIELSYERAYMNELVERQTKQILDTNKQLMRQAKQYKIASMQRYNIIVEYDIETKQGEFLYYDQGVPSNKHFLCSEYIRKYVYEHDQEKLLKMMEIAIEHSTENDTKLRMVSFEFQSEFHWYQVIASPIWNADNEVKQVLFTFSDIDEQYKKELELQKKAQLDILTGVLNRNAGEEKINEKLKAYSYKQDSVLFMIDIDDFKIINDTYGHDMGDSVLIKVAKIIESNCQESLVGRFGGDEFFIFIDNIKSYDDVHSCAKQIIDEVRLLGKSEFCPTVSIGIAKVREHDTFISLMKRADMALYTIKGSGKGSCCFYEEKEAVYENGFVLGLELGSEQKRDKQKNIGKQDLQDVRIMVVDDNNASLRVLSEFLQKRGATVSYKENAEIAMQEYMDSPLDYYDMILLDIVMPEIDGYHFCSSIRKLIREDAKRIPIIVVSSRVYEGDLIRAKKVGINEILPKPLEEKKFYKLVEKYLQGEMIDYER